MWSKQYQWKLAEIPNLQAEITQDITDNLKMNLTGAQKTRLAQRSTQNSEAYQLYLQGRFYWNRRTAGGAARAIDYFQQAIEKDPHFALAYSGLADSYFSLARNSTALSPKEAGAKARQSAEKAVEIEPSLAEAHASLALVLLIFDWNFPEADREFRRAIDLNPRYPYAHQWYAELLYATGRYEESVSEVREAVKLEPFASILHTNLAFSLMLAGRYPEAEHEISEALEMDPGHPIAHSAHARLLVQANKFDEAATEMEYVVRAVPESSYFRAYLGFVLAKAGRTEEARKLLGELIEEARTKYVSWLGIADLYSGLGEKEHAFAAMELAYQQGDTRMVDIRARSDLNPSWKADPRFADLLKKIGLPPLN